MNTLTFAQLCAEFAAATEEITRLSGLMPSFRSDEHPYELEIQKKRRDTAKEAIKRHLEANHG